MKRTISLLLLLALCCGLLCSFAAAEEGNDIFIAADPEFVIAPAPDFIDPALPPVPFADVTADDWYYGVVAAAKNRGYITGSNDLFRPNDDVSRAECITMLWRVMDKPMLTPSEYVIDFYLTDVQSVTDWSKNAVAWSLFHGYVTGGRDGDPMLSASMTREQLAAVLFRVAAANGMETVMLNDLLGGEDVSPYAVTAVNWAVQSGILKGSSAGLRVKDTVTRAEAAAMLVRFADYFSAISAEN